MSKEPDMTELTKLARAEWMADTLDADDCYINLRIKAHHAAEKAKADLMDCAKGIRLTPRTETIAALDALILTPPADPLLVEAREIAADWMDQMPDFQQQIRRGEQDESPIVLATLAALRRGLELREGGGV